MTTSWTVMLDGEALTWTALAREYAADVKRRGADLRVAARLTLISPLQFDVAEGLPSKTAQELVMWLREWLPEKGRGRLRLVPSIPSAEVARMRRDPPRMNV